MNQVLKHGSYTRTNGAQVDNVWPEFFLDTIEDQAATAREGRACFKEEERVRMHFPGDQTKKPVFKVTPEYIDRWPDAYKAFKEGYEVSLNGTPIDHWAALRKPHILELKAMGFRTIEDCAAMTDLAVQKVGMGGARIKQMAQAYLDDAAEGAIVAQVTAENEKMRREIAELSEKVTAQATLLERVSAQLINLQNTPSPLATYVPGMNDPIAAAQQAQGAAMLQTAAPSHSSLMDLPPPRRRGRPPASEASA
jgi:hypothetical protein